MGDVEAINLVFPRGVFQALELAAQQRRKTESEIVVEAVEAYLGRAATLDPLVGLFADEPELIDRVTDEVMRQRELTPLRTIS